MKLLACCIALALSACGTTKSAPSPTPVTPVTTAKADDPSCPLLVPGTSLSVEDTEAGAALVFVTTGDAVAVRSRAAALAAMHTKHDGPSSAMGMMFSPTSTATAMEIEGGARVEFAAATPNQVGDLQKELRMHAGHLTGGSCEM